MTSTIALVHQSGRNLPKNERGSLDVGQLWRVKNWKRHPYDPGWDDGLYCRCHEGFRNARTRHRGEIIVDCVNDGNLEAGYAVRSYFKISNIDHRMSEGQTHLVFDTYYFADEKPYRLRRHKIGPRGTKLNEEESNELRTHPSYHVYKISLVKGPSSIDAENWKRMMIAKARAKTASTIISLGAERGLESHADD